LNPGWEGNTCVKWLRRLELISQPNMSRDETSKYTDPLPNESARQFSFVMDAKSTITYPTHPVQLPAPGWLEIRGLAWSGRGRIAAVDVSTDGGRSWIAAKLQEPVLDKAVTRFTQSWQWTGDKATLLSRAVDATGYVQPSLAEFRAGRGAGTDYHYNHLRAWTVEPDGRVSYEVAP
jgi:sulfane dehydrogenase subunit SoxC